MEPLQLDRDKLSFLSHDFSIDVPLPISDVIDKLESAVTTRPLEKPKNSLLKIAALHHESYLFSFEGLGVLGSLYFRGVLEPIDQNKTTVKGFARLSNTSLLKNAFMILITLLFISLPYLSIVFLVFTVSSLYFDIRLLRNAANVLEKVFESNRSRGSRYKGGGFGLL